MSGERLAGAGGDRLFGEDLLQDFLGGLEGLDQQVRQDVGGGLGKF